MKFNKTECHLGCRLNDSKKEKKRKSCYVTEFAGPWGGWLALHPAPVPLHAEVAGLAVSVPGGG